MVRTILDVLETPLIANVEFMLLENVSSLALAAIRVKSFDSFSLRTPSRFFCITPARSGPKAIGNLVCNLINWCRFQIYIYIYIELARWVTVSHSNIVVLIVIPSAILIQMSDVLIVLDCTIISHASSKLWKISPSDDTGPPAVASSLCWVSPPKQFEKVRWVHGKHPKNCSELNP